MKYTHGKHSVSFNDWLNDQSDYLRVVAFVQDVFKTEGYPISVDIPVPMVRTSQFHYNTNDYLFCRDNDAQMYLSDKLRGKRLAASLITALVHYYSKNLFPMDEEKDEAVRSKILDDMVVELTLA